ncbi:MAG: hypothetical protein RLN76_03225 [Phycisphaeraceae bacterium]
MQTPTRRIRNNILMLAALAVCILPTQATAQLRPGWDALPAETVFCVRMPDTKGFLEQLRDTTALGKRILTEDRLNQVRSLITESDAESWEEFTDQLAEFGFTPEDLIDLATSNWGFAVIAEPRPDMAPRTIGVFWADLDDEMIDRLYTATDRALQKRIDEGDDNVPTRVDLELAGVEVRQLTENIMGMDRELGFEMPDNFEQMSQEEIQEHFEEQRRLNEQAQQVTVDQTHTLIARMPGRLIMAIGFPQLGNRGRDLANNNAAGNIDWETETDLQTLHAVTARLLAAQTQGAADPFVARVQATPAIATVVPEQGAVFEIYADLALINNIIREQMIANENPENVDTFNTIMSTLGLDRIGMLAGAIALDGQALRTNFFLGMPEPRTGLPQTFAANTLPPTPPGWVPTDVGYTQLAYDLGLLYDLIIETTVAVAGPEARQGVDMANGTLFGFVQADIRTLLSSLGTRHSIVLAKHEQVMATDYEYNEQTDDWDEIEVPEQVQPVALVWEVTDADLWQRVINALAMTIVPQSDGAIESIDQQGFSGLRSSEEVGPPMGLMLGNGRLVLTVGPAILDRLLTLLNNPPDSRFSMAGSVLYQDANRILNLRPGMSMSIQDGGASTIDLKNFMLWGLDNTVDAEPLLRDKIRNLMPSDEDIAAAFGVSAAQITFTPEGMLIESAAELPNE